MLMKFGCMAGRPPRPIKVVTAGASSVSTSMRNSSCALAWMMPPPAYTKGRLASHMACAAHAHLARRPRVALRRERRILLVPHQHVLDRRIVDGVIKRQRDTAWVAEDDLYLFPRQALQHHLRAAHEVGRHNRL